jgi:hypothetical protein
MYILNLCQLMTPPGIEHRIYSLSGN